MDKQKEAWVKWFLNFINVNLDAISERERADLAWDIIAILKGYLFAGVEGTIQTRPGDVADSLLPYPIWDEAIKPKAIQNRLREFFEQVMENIGGMGKNRQSSWKVLEDIETSHLLYEFPLKMTIELKAAIPLESKTKYKGKTLLTRIIKENALYRWQPDAQEKSPIILSIKSSKHAEILIYHFIRVLEGLPLGVLHQCPECGRWFLHTSKRERTYCSNLCASREGSRKRREQLKSKKLAAYEVELEKSRERAHKSYVNKVKKTIPGAKVTRRPQKPK